MTLPPALFHFLPADASSHEATRAPAARASVVIPAFNAAATIERCLRALDRQAAPRETYEIIVVDDGSTDDTPAKAASITGVRLIRSAHRGAAAARNCGAHAAHGEILLFTDADCEPTENWMTEMLAPFADPKVVGAKGTYRTRQRELVARFVQCEHEEKYACLAGAHSIDFVDTYSAAYRRDALIRSGGFDEAFPSASVEDQELSFRLAESGARLVFVPTAIVFHQHANSLAAYVRRKFWIGYGKIRVHRRHPGKAWRDSRTPATEKAQVLLVPAIVAALSAAFLVPPLGLIVALVAAIFVGSALPLVVRIARTDPPVVPLAPVMIVARAVALASGLALGFGAELVRSLNAAIGRVQGGSRKGII